MSVRIIPAIMSGGAGARLWPLSTQERPKQFHTLGGTRTLFAETLARVRGNTNGLSFAAPIVLCNARHEALVRENLGGVEAALVLEPAARNTAAVGAIAAAIAYEIDPYAFVLLLPSDHMVDDIAAFHGALTRAAQIARDHIATLGVAPNRPATHYGYIKRGAVLGDGVFAVDAFKEKPDEATARGYLASGDYFWNAGVFLFHPAALLAAFDASADIRDAALAALAHARRDGDAIQLDEARFVAVRAAPIDIAVMEKTARGAVAPSDMGWADLGAWDEVWRRAPRDNEGFALLGEAAAADASKIDAAGVKAAVIEGEDLVVVAAPNAVLILPRELARDRGALKRLAASR